MALRCHPTMTAASSRMCLIVGTFCKTMATRSGRMISSAVWRSLSFGNVIRYCVVYVSAMSPDVDDPIPKTHAVVTSRVGHQPDTHFDDDSQ